MVSGSAPSEPGQDYHNPHLDLILNSEVSPQVQTRNLVNYAVVMTASLQN